MTQKSKSYALLFAVVMLATAPYAYKHMPSAQASDQNEINASKNEDSHKSENDSKKNEDDHQHELNQIGEQEQEEGDVHHILEQEQDHAKKITVAEVHAESLVTYGNAITLLQSFQASLDQLKAVGASSTLAQTAGLSQQEKDLLSKLLAKHNIHFTNSDARIAELSAQITDLITTLTPLATQPISESAGIKQLLVSTLEGYADQINKLTDLEDLDLEIVDNETL